MTDYHEILLKQIPKELAVIRAEQTRQGKELAAQKVRAGFWGTIGGSITASVWLFVAYVKGQGNNG